MPTISLLTNVAAFNAKRHLDENSHFAAGALERIASGRRINRPGDDSAGYSISQSLEATIRSIQQANRNTMEGLSMVQVAEGGMSEVSNILVRLRELAIQAASDTIGDKERELLQLEVTQLKTELERIAQTTKYFDTNLLNGTGKEFTFQIGPDNNENNRITYDTKVIDLRPDTLGIDSIDVQSQSSALDSLEAIDEGIKKVAIPRAVLGSMQTRMTSIAGQLSLYEENMTAANSRIRDADLAAETTRAVQGQILQKASLAVLAQANALPNMALRLINE